MSTTGARLEHLLHIMATLRGPDGCPWDRAQTLASLRPYLLEETYEALDALDRGDPAALCEELGDLLFEIVFLSRIAEESGAFSMADAIDAVSAKLVRRHPHVFGEAGKLADADAVRDRWEELKAGERKADGQSKTLLGGVPPTLPALLRAYEYSSRAATVGFDWARATDVLDKMEEELTEIRQVVEQVERVERVGQVGRVEEVERVESVGRVEEEVGDLLFAIANLSRKLGVEPEGALRRANDKFRTRFTAVEQRIEARGERLQDKTLEELEAEWQAVKGAADLDGAKNPLT